MRKSSSCKQYEEESDAARRTRGDLDAAKQRVLNAAMAIQPLAPVREQPLASICGAFLLGFGLTELRGNVKALPMVPLLLDLSDIALRFKAILRAWSKN